MHPAKQLFVDLGLLLGFWVLQTVPPKPFAFWHRAERVRVLPRGTAVSSSTYQCSKREMADPGAAEGGFSTNFEFPRCMRGPSFPPKKRGSSPSKAIAYPDLIADP